MAGRLVLWTCVWLGTSLIFIVIPLCKGQATGSCNPTKESTCRCTYNNGAHIDLTKISKIGKFMFDYQPSEQLGSPFVYAYNPCYPVTDTESCTDIAACQKNAQDESVQHFPLGDASSATFTGSDDNIAITYSSKDDAGTTRTLTVTLVCDETASTPTLKIHGEGQTNEYSYTLISECCCPDGCGAVTNSSNGLSFGSILCIIFSCLLVVYLVAGVLFMKFVRKAEGKEVIPNYTIWVQVPGLIKDGGKYTYTRIGQLFGKQPGTYDDI